MKNLFIWRHVDRKMLVFVAAAFLLMGLSPVDAAFKCVSGTGNNGDVESTTSTLTERIEASLDAFDSFDHLWVSHSLRKLRDRDHHCLHGWFQNSGLRESVSVEGSDEHLVIVVPDDYPTIQDAVDASSPGDTLTVRDGFYKENVVVDKPYLTIKSENGSENCIVKAADTHEAVFSIYADHTNLNGFTVTGATYADGVYVFRSDFCSISNNNISDNNKSSRIGCGINLVYSSNNRVSNNIISKNVCGISLYSSNNNEIFFNNIISNHASSIDCWGSSNNNISNNTISNNGDGISFVDSSNNEIANNTISNNGWYGVCFYNSSSNKLSNNTLTGDGIYVLYSYHNIVKDNTVNEKPLVYLEGKSGVKINDAGQVVLVNCSNIEVANLNLSNTDIGIELWNTHNCIIKSNTIWNHNEWGTCGISLSESSNNNKIFNNSISNNDAGIHLWRSSNNRIFNNDIFSNNVGVSPEDSSNNNEIFNNDIKSNSFGVILGWGSTNNTIYHNNFIKNKVHASFLNCFFNCWSRNYWDNWVGFGPKVIWGTIWIVIPWISFDWHPAKEPWEGEK